MLLALSHNALSSDYGEMIHNYKIRAQSELVRNGYGDAHRYSYNVALTNGGKSATVVAINKSNTKYTIKCTNTCKVVETSNSNGLNV